jgi:acetyl-CoA/propionyl-CoA carboxylase carboxyl transferase subunit
VTHEDRVEDLRERKAAAERGGGEERIEAQHEKGKLTARERIDYFLDDDSFVELDQLREHRSTNFDMAEKQVPGDGVVTGYGEVEGRKVFVFAHDFTVFGGALGEVFAEKVCKVMDKAVETGSPTSSTATSRPAASSRRFRRSWARAPAAPSTRRPSPTSSTW